MTYYLARDTYPSEIYYEIKETGKPGQKAVVFISQPATVDEEVIVFCNIAGDPDEETEVEIGVKPGGWYLYSNRRNPNDYVMCGAILNE